MGHALYFSPDTFGFLGELRANNNRDWFLANRARYESVVRDPFLQFIADLAPRLERISPHLVADPRPSGGSFIRIFRDTRFSKDKSPYKWHAAAHFRHVKGKDIHAPGFYLHLEPRQVFAANGLWHPDPPTLARIREAIVASPARWERALSNKPFKSQWTLEGEKLKRPPAGYDPSHPLIEDLKRKDFISSLPFTEAQACADDFLDRFVDSCQAASPFIQFLTRAVGLEW